MKDKLKKLLLGLCIAYTGIGLISHTIKTAWALDEWDVSRMIEDKISAYDYDFESAVRDVVEDCSISCYESYGDINCKIDC